MHPFAEGPDIAVSQYPVYLHAKSFLDMTVEKYRLPLYEGRDKNWDDLETRRRWQIVDFVTIAHQDDMYQGIRGRA